MIKKILSLFDSSDYKECIVCKNKFRKSKFYFCISDLGVCRKCHDTLPFVNIGMLFRGKKYVDYSMSVFYYVEPIRKLLVDYKFNECKSYGIIFGEYLSQLIRGIFMGEYDFNMIVPVPLSRERFNERGYNQAAIIADYLACELGVVYSENAIIRYRNTKRQSSLKPSERAFNLKNAFLANSQIVSGRNILLVDDVYTSGNTVEECAKILKEAGAERVIVLTAARKYNNVRSKEYRELFGM